VLSLSYKLDLPTLRAEGVRVTKEGVGRRKEEKKIRNLKDLGENEIGFGPKCNLVSMSLIYTKVSVGLIYI